MVQLQIMTKASHDSEVLAQNQQVITACAFIHHTFNGVPKVFLPKRSSTKKFLPGVYELPGGHIDFGEEPVVGLKREIHEELGANIEVGDPFYIFTYLNEIKGSHSVEIIYFAKFTNDNINNISLNAEDHSEYGWFSENELINATTENKDLDDIEFVAMKKGFALLNGESQKFF